MWQALLDLIFPRICVACSQPLNQGEQHICTHCQHELPQTKSHLGYMPELDLRLAGRVPLRHNWSFLIFTKKGKVQRIVHALKYRGNQAIGELLGRWYGAILKAQVQPSFDVLLPVPLHPRKLAKRGYNQADCWARGLSQTMGIPVESDWLKREKLTDTQTRKSRLERAENMRNVFYVNDPKQLQGKSVALVDDVITTGATLEACTEVLLQAGAKDVSVITLAMAVSS
jgi:ComF family protein